MSSAQSLWNDGVQGKCFGISKAVTHSKVKTKIARKKWPVTTFTAAKNSIVVLINLFITYVFSYLNYGSSHKEYSGNACLREKKKELENFSLGRFVSPKKFIKLKIDQLPQQFGQSDIWKLSQSQVFIEQAVSGMLPQAADSSKNTKLCF